MSAWLDLFAGHGVGVAMKGMGIEEHAVEMWQDAIDTRLANGLSEPVYRDAWEIERAEGLDVEGIWASPPCQTFSAAGTGSGRGSLSEILRAVESEAWRSPGDLRAFSGTLPDTRTGLVLSPLSYVSLLRPRYVILEQVTPVLPIWESFTQPLKSLGYSVWTGILDAADYGVPQTRKRAYLIARRGEGDVEPPKKQHRVNLDSIRPDQEGLISNYSSGSRGIEVPGNKKPRGYRRIDQPAFTVTGKVRANKWHPSLERVTVQEALKMQSYPDGFIVSGDWSLQIGNAVPPRLAEAVLSSVRVS